MIMYKCAQCKQDHTRATTICERCENLKHGKTCVIRKQYGRYYLSFDSCKSRKTYKTVAGAAKYAEQRGMTVVEVDHQEVVPLSCIPGTESYNSF
jgi:hypothetical protein